MQLLLQGPVPSARLTYQVYAAQVPTFMTISRLA